MKKSCFSTNMRKITIILISLLLLGCNKNYHVALYEDEISKDNILAIFPVRILEVAMNNCELTVKLYQADDIKERGKAEVYYCQQISELDILLG